MINYYANKVIFHHLSTEINPCFAQKNRRPVCATNPQFFLALVIA